MSLKSKLFRLMIKASGRKRTFRSEDALRRYVARRRPAKESKPPRKLASNFHIDLSHINERPVYYLQPKAQAAERHIIYLHGGSYVAKMMRPHWSFIGRLTQVTSCTVSVPLYGLAPEYSHRDAFDLLKEHYQRLLETHAPESIVLMGDSAGGGLALAFAQHLAESGQPQVGRVVMLCPWLDITLSNPDIPKVLKRDPLLDIPGNREAGRMWAAGTDPHDPKLSPLYGPLDGLPPLCLLIGTDDGLLPDARRFRDQARAAAQPLDYREYPSMYHVWMLLPMPEADRAIEDIVRFIAPESTGRQQSA